MAASTRRSRTRDTNIWPGFVDALATLLMVIIFVLMVFIVAQFYLTQLLSGRDEALSRLQRQVAEISDLLSLERETSAELRVNVAQLSVELQASVAARDTLSAQVGQLLNQRDQLEDRLATAVSEQARLRQRVVEIESNRDGLDIRVAQVRSERDTLLAKLRAVEEEARLTKAERDELNAGMTDALKILDANRDTIKVQLRDLESLRRDIAALDKVRTDLEQEVTELLAVRILLEGQLKESVAAAASTKRDLEAEQENARLTRDELAQVLEKLNIMQGDLAASRTKQVETAKSLAAARERETETAKALAALQGREAETAEALAAARKQRALTADALTAARQRTKLGQRDLDEARSLLRDVIAKLAVEKLKLTEETKRNDDLTKDKAAREASIAELTALIAQTRDRTKALETRLSEAVLRAEEADKRGEAAEKRTVLAQKQLDARDIRLEELVSNYNLSLDQLTEEQRISAAAQRQVEQLNSQLLTLRRQIASLQDALDASETENAAKNVKIVDLGSRLNKALASKVQELARFRSEFFGRLREVLKNRQDIRIVGDRFVFQSEVLFDSGAASIAADGQSELRRLARALNEIAPKIPENINWILQIEGHTDNVPIFNEQFKSNWELAAARAISVVQFLIAQGVPANRLSATGYGEFQPLDQRHDEIGHRRNRRIEMKLTQR